MASSSRKSRSAVSAFSSPLIRSSASTATSPSPFASSSSSSSAVSSFAYSSGCNSFLPHRSASPTRVSLAGSSPPPRTPSFRFSLERSISPGRSLAHVDRRQATAAAHAPARRTCMCSPTTHPGSFRCSLHKGLRYPPFHHQNAAAHAPARRTCMCSPTTHPGSFRCSLHKGLRYPPFHHQNAAASSPSNCLNARRSAMTNSLVRIGAVEGEWVKRALAALIRPSSHQQRRRAAFHPRPSRLSVMS